MTHAMRDADIDQLSADGAQEAWEIHTYRIHLQADQFDNDSQRFEVEVRASGPNDAINQARLDHRGSGVRRWERLD